jgi:hypothetical protein
MSGRWWAVPTRHKRWKDIWPEGRAGIARHSHAGTAWPNLSQQGRGKGLFLEWGVVTVDWCPEDGGRCQPYTGRIRKEGRTVGDVHPTRQTEESFGVFVGGHGPPLMSYCWVYQRKPPPAVLKDGGWPIPRPPGFSNRSTLKSHNPNQAGSSTLW